MTDTETELSKKLLHAQERLLHYTTRTVQLEQRIEKLEAVVEAMTISRSTKPERTP
jgi:hypothetical protein